MTPDLGQARRAAIDGARARTILDDPLLTDAFAAIEAELHASWAGSRADDAAGREDAFRMLRALASLKSRLRKIVDDGLIAQSDIDRHNEAERRKANRGET